MVKEREVTSMTTITIRLNSIDKVKNFVNILTTTTDFESDLVSGRYVIDAKSIMGVFSLDLSKDITMNIHCDDKAELDALYEKLGDIVVSK